MANKNTRNPFAFTPTLLDQDVHEKRRVIKQLPNVHQTETLQKFFGASADHLFDPGKGKAINGYVGQKPLWYDPNQDYYLEETTDDRTFYQLEASMVSKSPEGQLTDLLPYPDLINQLRFQGALTNNHNRLFSQNYYTWCPPIDLDKIVNFRQYVWLPVDDVEPTSTFADGNDGWLLEDGSAAPTSGPFSGLSRYLGGFAGTPTGEQIVSKTFTLNSNVNSTNIQFDFLKLNSWDSQPGIHIAPQANGPECLSVYLNNQLAFQFTPVDIAGLGGSSLGSGTIDLGDIQGTYNVTSPGADSQLDADNSFPPSDPFPNGPATWTDRVYRITLALTGTSKTLKLGFGSNTDESIGNEALGIDNVRVYQSQSTFTTIAIYGPTYSFVADGSSATFALPGYGPTDPELAALYDLGSLTADLMVATVDGVAKPFTIDTNGKTITFAQRPAADAEVQISCYSDLENNAVGLAQPNPKAFGGVKLSSGMRITVKKDKNTDYTGGDVWIVENVGRSIFLIKENSQGLAQPDYILMERGAANQNEWSTGNRWFHVSTLSPNLDPDFVLAHRATRPIIEFRRDLELFNYGTTRRLPVDIVVENVDDLNAALNLTPQSIILDGVSITTRGTNLINVNAVNPDTNTTYGDVESIRLLVRNTVNDLLNNKVFVLVNQGNVLKLILETDGNDPSGAGVYGEVFRVRLGSHQNQNLHWDGSNWVVSQNKTKANQAPLFELYDLNGVNLRDAGAYPNSTFQGSKIFSYQIDTTGSRIADQVLGIPLVHDNKGQILFENYLATEVFQYVVGGKFINIDGFYFHHDGNILSNDWYKAPAKTRQFMVDRYVSDGRSKLFKISQPADELTVTIGRVDENKSFNLIQLVEDKDFIRVDRQIMVLNIQNGDIVEIHTYNPANPPADAEGHYEVPLNLQANPDNLEVSRLTKGDFYDHFSEIMKKQAGFEGAEYADNNYRDTEKLQNLGTHIIQHSAGLLKTMLLAGSSQLDITSAIRYADGEYSRFKAKFIQKILDYVVKNRLPNATSYDTWINTALEELNKGKTKKFAFYLSDMAKNAENQLPTFIPATPSYLGVYPLYQPDLLQDTVQTTDGELATVWFIRGHDGSITQIEDSTVAQVFYAFEERIFNSIPDEIRSRERPIVDHMVAFGDQFRTNDYSYDEWLQVLRPSFERWSVAYGQDYKANTEADEHNPWTWNWSSQNVPGHWRGIYEKFYGTQRPDMTPWEALGFTIMPTWWTARYGAAPYTSENLVLWDDLEKGYVHEGDRQGINPEWARPGLSAYIPVDPRGRLRHPGPRDLIALYVPDNQLHYLGAGPEQGFLDWEYEHDEGVLGCGIAGYPTPTDRRGEWSFGDLGPVEQEWRRSSTYAFAAATASYLMKPAAFVDLGWNTRDISLHFKGTINEQYLNQDTKGRPRHASLQVYGEVLEDFTLVNKTGIQQWISDFLASSNTAINANFAEKVRGLGAQLSYKVAGFTDSSTLVVVSDAFGRVPSEDVTVSLYRSPSTREEAYSGVAISWTGQGYEIYGYDSLNPHFSIIPGNPFGNKTSVGRGATTAAVPGWRPNTYYQVNVTVKYGDFFYRALKTHTSSNAFEDEQATFWVQVARPQYADGTALVWALEGELDPVVEQVPYGTVLKTPQDVASFMNGYERYLKSRGWIFSDLNDSGDSVQDWKDACASFIIWSSSSEREVGDYISLSPLSRKVQFMTDQGAIQPIEQIVNGLYAVVDQNGQPIDNRKTSVIRNDGLVTVTCDLNSKGIYGLRLYVAEYEHVLVFNNQTIFGDTIYSPLLNIKQARLRVQGFKTVGWKGRIDAPGFIVTGDTLTPNFERAADDFRRFFETESMENKKLQDRARANFGYEEKEYLNNLLLTPTNQFEFYQGMIQQKGSPTSMRRLLRSNFVRHNKGLQLFEEWAFRVGDYGGQEVSPSLDIQIRQSEFKHNPQLILFGQTQQGTAPTDTYGVIKVNDIVDDQGKLISFDDRWHWRPDMNNIRWPYFEFGQEPHLPTPGYVKLDEVKFTVTTNDKFSTLYNDQQATDTPLQDRDRVWVYGIGEQSMDAWSTYKFNATGYQVINFIAPTFDDQSTVAVLNQDLIAGGDRGFYLSQINTQEQFILKDLANSDISDRANYLPKFSNSVQFTLDNTSNPISQLITMLAAPHMVVDSISVDVQDRFADGSTLEIGHENDENYFVQIRTEEPRAIYPTNYTQPTVLVQTPPVTYTPPYIAGSGGNQGGGGQGGSGETATMELVRVGTTMNVCGETVVTWTWQWAGGTTSGQVTFPRPSDVSTSDSNDGTYLQTIQVPVTPGQQTQGTLTVATNGQVSDQQVITVVPSNQSGRNFVDLTTKGVYPFTFNRDVNDIGAKEMLATLSNMGNFGKAVVTVNYHYTRGFELQAYTDGQLGDILISKDGGSASLYTWIKTRYPTWDAIPKDGRLWDNGDIVEVDNFNGLWAVFSYSNGWGQNPIRVQNRKINSDLLTSAAIYDSTENELRMVLQLYDPIKGYIPGVADRELTYKMVQDPANYDLARTTWGKEQVGELWWDQSTTRYLDYEITDFRNGYNYRWKNWGRVAPGSTIDIYEWTRSTVPPSGWNDYVASQAQLNIDNKPSGTVPDNASSVQFVTATEWNEDINADQQVYYFWVLNSAVTPLTPGRKLSAQQVSNIITNPSANDIPFFAVMGDNMLIVGGIKQYLNEQDTVLKVKWNLDAEIHNNHHKQWIILREADERNTINDSLWNKMRDSLVGWDATQMPVPDARLPKAQQVGAMVRPRQSWFPVDVSPNGGKRPARAARAAFVDIMNDVLAAQPFIDQGLGYEDLFASGETPPTSANYVTTALDLADLNSLLPAARNMVQPGECVFIENTVEAGGFWTLWQLRETNGVRSFFLKDLQKWRLQEGELWNLADWYADGWSAANFPNYRFQTSAARDSAGNLDVTLLKGTLVQIDHVDVDNRWTWDVYTSTTKYQVAKHNATIKLSDAFYDDSRVEFGPAQVAQLTNGSITPAQIQQVADIINYRDGSREIEYLLNNLKVSVFDILQKNTVFFSMVKSAFHQSTVVDWAFKTSFLYLGGYSENLTQSPVAFKDQIDNVISYLEDVKPYHVKIREYVRRLSYGPDLADLAITDFDKPSYPDGQRQRILDVNNPADQQIMRLNRPWKDWINTYQNEIKDVNDWNADWNGVRRLKVSVKFDRVACGQLNGWDTSPWDPSLLVYSQLGNNTQSLSALSAAYRNRQTDGSPNFYRDQTVETVEDRNYLVRKNIVTPDRPGTIVKVLSTMKNYMWSGLDWIEFQSIGWDQGPDMGTASRIANYRPLPGMPRADDENIIDGCGFDGTIITDTFQNGLWDVFEWDSTGFSEDLAVRANVDFDAIDGNSKDAPVRDEQVDEVPAGSVVNDFVLRSAGFRAPNQFSGVEGYTATHRSYGVYVFNSQNRMINFGSFDVFGSGEVGGTAADMVAFLNAIPDGQTVIVISHDEPATNHLTAGLDKAMARVGAGGLFLTDGYFKYRSAYILLGKAGVGENGGREFYRGLVADDASNYIDLNIRMVDGTPYVVSNQSSGQDDPAAIKVVGNDFVSPEVAGNRPRELVQIRGLESLVITVKKASGVYQKSFMNHRGQWQDTLMGDSAMSFVAWDQSIKRLILTVPNWAEDADGFTPLHDPQNPSTGWIREVTASKGYRSSSSLDMTAPGTKVFKLRDVNKVNGIPAGLRGNGVRVAIVNAKDPTKRALGTISASRGSEVNWDGTITVVMDTDGYVNIGSGKTWNIIPVELFNEPGIVWVGNARFTYNNLSRDGNTVTLTNAYLSATSLAPLTITDSNLTLTQTSPVLDGSLQRPRA